MDEFTTLNQELDALQNPPDQKDTKWIKEFYELYCSKNPENRDKAKQLLKENYPETICRYIPPRFIKDFIDGSKLTFIHPCKFEENDSRWFQFEQNKEYPDKINEIINVLEKDYKDDNGLLRNIHKICSLTTNPLDPYMWKNYAKEYSGICIEFCKNRPDLKSYETLTNFHEGHVTLLPVLYTKERPNLSNLLISLEKSEPGNYLYYKLDQLLVNLKNDDFRYEREWRATCYMCVTNKEPEKLSIATIPTNIYLGYQISKECKDEVLAYAKEKNITVYIVIKADNG